MREIRYGNGWDRSHHTSEKTTSTTTSTQVDGLDIDLRTGILSAKGQLIVISICLTAVALFFIERMTRLVYCCLENRNIRFFENRANIR